MGEAPQAIQWSLIWQLRVRPEFKTLAGYSKYAFDQWSLLKTTWGMNFPKIMAEADSPLRMVSYALFEPEFLPMVSRIACFI